jgi:hypothetical protein
MVLQPSRHMLKERKCALARDEVLVEDAFYGFANGGQERRAGDTLFGFTQDAPQRHAQAAVGPEHVVRRHLVRDFVHSGSTPARVAALIWMAPASPAAFASAA